MLQLIPPWAVTIEGETGFRGSVGQLQELINFYNTHIENEKMSGHTATHHNRPVQTSLGLRTGSRAIQSGVYLWNIMEHFRQDLFSSSKREKKSKLNKY